MVKHLVPYIFIGREYNKYEISFIHCFDIVPYFLVHIVPTRIAKSILVWLSYEQSEPKNPYSKGI